MTTIAVHLYINGTATYVYNLNKSQTTDFRHALLEHLKPVNKHYYLELDLDSNEEYGILKCTNEHDDAVNIPNEIISKINKYLCIPWKHEDKLSVLLSLM